jgi:hypothetical protein
MMLTYFKPDEFDNFQMMNSEFLLFIDSVRDKVAIRWKIKKDYATAGHSPTSMHYQGRAIDFKMLSDADLLSQASHLLNCLCGSVFRLGVYPGWNEPGFHLDNKPQNLFWVFDYTRPQGNEYVYFTEKGKMLEYLAILL